MPKPQQLVIDMDAAGNVTISGPISNRALCYAMLEVGKDLVREASYVEEAKAARESKREGPKLVTTGVGVVIKAPPPGTANGQVPR